MKLFDNKGEKYLLPNILPEIIKDALQKGRLDYTPVFDKTTFGCGGTHGILNYTSKGDENIVELTPSVVAVRDKAKDKHKYPPTTTFLYGSQDVNVLNIEETTVFYTTPEYFSRIKSRFPLDKTLVIYDEFHDMVDSRSYRNSIQLVDERPFIRLGMTATVPPIFEDNIDYKVENIYTPEINYRVKPIALKEHYRHVDETTEKIIIDVHEVIDKKPHVVMPDVKQILKLIGYAQTHKKKILLKLGNKGKFIVDGLQGLDCIAESQDDYDFSAGTVSGTAGIDLNVKQDECYVFISSMSKNNTSVGFTEEQGLQAGGRFREAKTTHVKCYTTLEAEVLDEDDFLKVKKEAEAKGYATNHDRNKVKRALINRYNSELTPKYGIYDVVADDEYMDYLCDLSRNVLGSSRKWRKLRGEYREKIEYEQIGMEQILTFKIDLESKDERYKDTLKDTLNYYIVPEKYEEIDKEYLGLVQSKVYDHITKIEDGSVDTEFGKIEYKFLDDTTVQVTDFPNISERAEKVKKQYDAVRKVSVNRFNLLLNRELGTEGVTTSLFKTWKLTNKKLEGKEDLKHIKRAFRYVNNKGSTKEEEYDSYMHICNNYVNKEIFKLFFDVMNDDLEKCTYEVLLETQQWTNLSENKHREYGSITNTNKKLRHFILEMLYGNNVKCFDIKSCAPTVTAVLQLGLDIPDCKDFYKGEGWQREINKEKLNQFLNFKHKESIDISWVQDVKKACTYEKFIDAFVYFHEEVKMKDKRLKGIPLYFDSYTYWEKDVIKHLRECIQRVLTKSKCTRLHDELIVVDFKIAELENKIIEDYKYPIENNKHIECFNPITLKSTIKSDKAFGKVYTECASCLMVKEKREIISNPDMKPKNYTIVNNSKEVEEYISKYDTLAYDTETTGLNIRRDQVVMISLTGTGYEGIAWPIQRWDKDNQRLIRLVDRQEVKRVLDPLVSKKIITHNFLFDGPITQNDIGVDLRNSLHFDTMLAYHTLYEELCAGEFKKNADGAGLKQLAQKYLGETTDEQQIMQKSIKANGGKKGELYKADIDKLGKYACMDTDFTFRLYKLFEQLLKDDGTYEYFYKERIPTYAGPSYSLNTRGLKIDKDLNEKLCKQVTPYVEQYTQEFRDAIMKDRKVFESFRKTVPFNNAKKLIKQDLNIIRLDRATREQISDENIKEYLLSEGTRTELLPDDIVYRLINPNANTAIGNVARDLGLRYPGKDDKWKDRNKKKVDWVRALYRFKKFSKIASTYILNLQENSENGIHYPVFKDIGTVSGRYSGGFQQLPRAQDNRDPYLNDTYYEASNSIREQFIPREGYVFLDADYESLEPHIFAELSQDPKLIQIYDKGLDYHSYIAIIVEDLKGVSADKKSPNYLGKVNPGLRAKAKSYSLGIPYGMGAMGIADIFKCSVNEGQVKINRFYKGFDILSKWRDKCIDEVDTEHKIKIKSGNVRHFTDYENMTREYYGSPLHRKAMNKAHNAVINVQQQSYAASIVNRASIRIQKYLEERDWGNIVMNVHDQVVVEIKEEHADTFIPIMKDMLENTTKLKHVTLKADPEKAYNLAEGH